MNAETAAKLKAWLTERKDKFAEHRSFCVPLSNITMDTEEVLDLDFGALLKEIDEFAASFSKEQP